MLPKQQRDLCQTLICYQLVLLFSATKTGVGNDATVAVTSRVPSSVRSSAQLQKLEIGMKTMGISLILYSTYMYSFNFRSVVLPEILLD